MVKEIDDHVVHMINDQFTLEEQLLKRKISCLELELARGNHHLSSLQQLINSQKYMIYQQASPQHADNINNDDTDDEVTTIVMSSSTRSAKRQCVENMKQDLHTLSSGLSGSKRQSSSLYSRRADGKFVRFKCPQCERMDFNSRVGFINHCKNAHELCYNSVQEYFDYCHVEVDDSEVPADDPCRWQQSVGVIHQMDSIVDGMVDENGELVAADLQLMGIKEFDDDTVVAKVITLDDDDVEESIDEPATPVADQELESSLQQHQDDEQKRKEKMGTAYTEFPEHGRDMTALGLPSMHVQKQKTSRYYIKRRVIIGTTSQCLPASSGTKDTHKWSIYVKCPNPDPRQPNEISTFVRAVKFYLHPSLKPNDVVKCDAPPFFINNTGWGEFPVRIRLYFWDDEMNKPVDLIHQLTLCRTDLNGSIKGPEIPFDIELARESHFMEACGPTDLELENQHINMSKYVVKREQFERSMYDKARILDEAAKNNDNLLFSAPLIANEAKHDKRVCDHCKFCGSHLDIHRFDFTEARRTDKPTQPHDPSKCQFRPVTRKGKVRSIFTTAAPFNSLIDSVTEHNGLHVDISVNSPKRIAASNIEKKSFDMQSYETMMERVKTKIPKEQWLWPLDVMKWKPQFEQQLRLADSRRCAPPMRQRAEQLSIMIYAATSLFAKKLLSETLELYLQETAVEEEDQLALDLPETPEAKPDKIITPYHLYRILYSKRKLEYDFLTTSFLETSKETPATTTGE